MVGQVGTLYDCDDDDGMVKPSSIEEKEITTDDE